MATFENSFAFSFSQYRRFSTCRRRWWLEKVEAWKGWNKSAPLLSRLAYRGKQMNGVYSLAGRAVHEVAEQAVAGRATLETGLRQYDARMRSGWKQAAREAQVDESDRAKHKVNLFELYYRNHGIDDLEGYARRAFERGRSCVESIFDSAAYLGVLEGELIEAEQLKQFTLEDVPVWVVVDLAFRDADGYLNLWDWKSGKPNEKDPDQLALYALFAMIEHGVALRDIRFGLSYLLEGRDEIVNITEAHVERVKARILSEAREIRRELPNPRLNDNAPVSSFPETDNRETCARCELFFACKGHRDLSRPDLTAEGFER